MLRREAAATCHLEGVMSRAMRWCLLGWFGSIACVGGCSKREHSDTQQPALDGGAPTDIGAGAGASSGAGGRGGTSGSWPGGGAAGGPWATAGAGGNAPGAQDAGTDTSSDAGDESDAGE